MARVKCAECGLLSVFKYETGLLVEVNAQIRKQGNLPTVGYEKKPSCFGQACDLGKEAGGTGSADFLRVIARERDCDEFTPWRQGFSPKEHQVMLTQERERKWQEDRLEKDRQFQQELREKDQRRQDELRAEDQRRVENQRWYDRRWNVFTILLAFALAAGWAIFWAWLQPHLSQPAQAPPSTSQPGGTPATPPAAAGSPVATSQSTAPSSAA